MTPTTEGELFREKARQCAREAYESFERCDTDGALSQWASGISRDKYMLMAQLADNGWISTFRCLFTLDGQWVPSVEIEGKWGLRWMVLDESGKTLEFVPYHPARRSTLANRGYTEGLAVWSAQVRTVGRDMMSVQAAIVKNAAHLEPPQEIIYTDRFMEATK
jgi:hypothetical protein